MKPARLFLVALLALAVSGEALAQHQGRGGRGAGQGQKQQQQQAQRPVMPPAQGPQREATYRQAQPQRQGGRMSNEEREQLKRDISDHGRDIYQDRGARR